MPAVTLWLVLITATIAALTDFKFIVRFSLQCGGRVCYLGWGSLGLLGLIDASECKPTFGAGKISHPQKTKTFLDSLTPCKSVRLYVY